MPSTSPADEARVLLRYRQRLELTQEALAERARLEQTTISKLETGKVRRAHYKTVAKLARALETEPSIIREAIAAAHRRRRRA
jgi:transcriptional regulator with XRE-family HTH domain